KLLVALAAHLTGFRGDQNFERIGIPYTGASAFALRFLPALAGTFLPVVFFLLLEALGASLPIAFLGGFALVFDNGFTLQSRLMGLYPLLILAIVGSLLCFLKAKESKHEKGWYGTS